MGKSKQQEVLLNEERQILIERIIALEQEADERKHMEDALLASEERYRSYIELTEQLGWTTNANGEVTEDIPSWRKYTGQSKKDVMGWGWAKALHPDDVEKTILIWNNAVKSKSRYETEYRVRRGDGAYRHFLARGVPVFNRNRTIREWVGTCIDITDRITAEKSSKERQALNERLLNAIPHPAMLINTKRVVQAANKIALDFGVKIHDYCWREFGKCEYLSPEDRKRSEENPDDEGIKCTFCLADEAMNGPERITMNDPEVKAFDRIWDTFWDPIDENTFLHYAIDVTERRKTEEKQKKYGEQLRELVEERTRELRNINHELEQEITQRKKTEHKMQLMALFAELNPSPVLRFDMDGKVLMANPAATEILGLGPVTGISLRSLIPGIEDIDLNDCINNGTIISHTAQIGSKCFHFIFRGLPNLKIGQTYGSDITRQREAEARTVRTNHLISLGELAAGVAHEINNPINGIINYSQILFNKSEEGSTAYDIADRIIKEGDRISSIVNSLLFFARERKKKKRPVHLNEIISNTLSLIEIQLRNDGITLSLDINPDLPRLMAHPQQLQQVFLNLISNSRYALNQKYNGTSDNKRIDISGKSALVAGRPCIQVTFYDRGNGIPADIKDSIMNPFFTLKPSGKGTGLGLSMSHGIINDHEGMITVESIENEFTKVLIELPCIEPRDIKRQE